MHERIPNFNWADVIPDFGLTWDQLAQKYDPDVEWLGHPVLTREMWTAAERPGIYWMWLVQQLSNLEFELSLDNPYN